MFAFQLNLLMALETMSSNKGFNLLWQWHQLCCLTLATQCYRRARASRPRRLWAHDRGLHRPGFFDQNLLGFFNAREFKARMRMDVSTFKYLCSTLSPYLTRQNINMRLAVPVQVKVAVSIARLATGSSMQSIADLYKIGLSTSQLAVSEFSGAMKSVLLRKFLRWPSASVMDKFAQEFQALHNIPYVVGPWMGPTFLLSYRACTPPTTITARSSTPYSCRQLFLVNAYSGTLTLGGLVLCMTRIYGQGRISGNSARQGDSHLTFWLEMPHTRAGRGMLAPFNRHKNRLTREQYNWNYVQSSTCVCIERAFGMLKGRWRILLKRVDVHLKTFQNL